jgi:hypothetical protein
MPQRKALLIGINYTSTNNELAGCVKDVEHGQTYPVYPQQRTHQP